MKTTEAIQHFGTIKNLAKALDITVHAIYQWPEDVPPLREYQINEKLFKKEAPLLHTNDTQA